MNSEFPIRGYRTGFFVVVALLVFAAAFTLWGELRTNARVDKLVGQALHRHELIGRIREDALKLDSAVDDHINAADDDERKTADEAMVDILADAKEAREDYTQDLPEGEREVWRRFDETARSLAQQVRTAVKFSNRKQAERARQHLEGEVKPVIDELHELADELSTKNADETRKTLHHREDLRWKTTLAAVVVLLAAIVASLLVSNAVMLVVRRQALTIREQLAELGRRNSELDAFASRVAHDLISPLSPLKGYLTLIRRSKSMTDPSVREMLELAESSAGRMAELVEALLRFCRAGMKGERVVAELDTAVTTLLLEVAQVAALNKVTLERELTRGVRVACPQQLLQSIAQNLLSNAVKYTAGKPRARVKVRVVAEHGEAILEVHDNGMGMSEETLRSLFQPFFRASEVRQLPGHGLGLATTKRLVESHNGTIDVKSQLNVGTQVTVRFPLAEAAVKTLPMRGASTAPAQAPDSMTGVP